ncbi:MAG TPA: bifunctional hydroxymethylpyrimidine kinase/phosphomethylpyrimidine kinase [Vibrio sp.]|nr:bifunctional hydroxymethylpyrimidine kinase/phosphomethylpyrimidine kinase [Vibrio sp.]
MTHQSSHATPIVLTIAGSDSSGGAGIQADIKAISATGGYACSVITAITAQNTQGVSAVYPIPIEHIAKQLDAVFGDLNVIAVKVGMLANSSIINVVADKLQQYRPKFVVVDPVMIATSGDVLLENEAILTMKQRLLPLANLITPNLPEGAALIECNVPTIEAQMGFMISDLRSLGAQSVLLKAGHLEGSQHSNDLLVEASSVRVIRAKRVETKNTHGTGCTLSSAIASYLAQGDPLVDAVTKAKGYLSSAIEHADGLEIGAGDGPVHHFYALNESRC